MIEKDLEQLGLDNREAGVYVLLLRLGDASATELIQRLGWHRQLIYNALDRLKRLGLVSVVSKGAKHRFRPASPKKIVANQQANVELANALLPALTALRPTDSQEFVEIYPGFAGIQFVHEDILKTLKKGESVLTLGASGPEYAQAMGDYHNEWTLKRIKKGIQLKVLGFRYQEEFMEELFVGAKSLTETRYLPKTYETPTSTKIYANKIIIQIWGPGEPIMILIENKAVAENYRNYFSLLWEQAK